MRTSTGCLLIAAIYMAGIISAIALQWLVTHVRVV